MKILSIGSDRNLFVEDSAVANRIKEYGLLVDELHIIVMTKSSLGLKEKKIGTNVWIYPTNSFTKWMYPFSASRLGKKIVFEKKFVRGESLITAQDPFECGWAGFKIKNKWRIPLEVQLHTDPFSPYFSGFLNSIRKIIAKRVIKNADNLRVVSKSVGEKITARFNVPNENISVLPIYIDRTRIEEGQINFDLHARFGWHFILLSVCRLTPEKNIPMILNVLKKLLEFFPTTGLVIVGAGPEEGKIGGLIKALGLEKNVALAGWQEDLASYYRSANMFVQTSFFEGYGLSLVEAGLSGLPIVTTAVGIANDLENGQDAYICPIGDVEYMFKAIYDLIENNPKRETLRLNIKHKLDSILITKEEYLVRLKKAWTDTASKVHV